MQIGVGIWNLYQNSDLIVPAVRKRGDITIDCVVPKHISDFGVVHMDYNARMGKRRGSYAMSIFYHAICSHTLYRCILVIAKEVY
jgi:hypothetical protein